MQTGETNGGSSTTRAEMKTVETKGLASTASGAIAAIAIGVVSVIEDARCGGARLIDQCVDWSIDFLVVFLRIGRLSTRDSLFAPVVFYFFDCLLSLIDDLMSVPISLGPCQFRLCVYIVLHSACVRLAAPALTSPNRN